jgi:SAM-dependent methyltransferase
MMPQILYVKEGTKMPKRSPKDFYPTPYPFALSGIKQIPEWFWEGVDKFFVPTKRWSKCQVLDPGAGEGVWGKALREFLADRNFLTIRSGGGLVKPEITGIDIRDLPKPDEYNTWMVGDFLVTEFKQKFSLIMGNPPYNNDNAMNFVEKSFDLLAPGGFIVFLLRLEFLGALKRMDFFHENPPFEVVVCSNRPSFTGNNSTGAENFAYFLWQKPGHMGRFYDVGTTLKWTEVPRGFTKEEMEAWQQKQTAKKRS